MLSLLLLVLVLGVIAWGLEQLPIHQMFKVIAYCIMAIFLLVSLFRVLGVALPGLN